MLLLLTSSAYVILDKCVSYLPAYRPAVKVAFIPTAGDPYPETPWQDADRNKLEELGFQVSTVGLKGKTEEQLRKELSDVQVLFVDGGNTFYLLEHAKKSGFLTIAQELIQKGVIYIGSSAGSIGTEY
jgi:dipeptidase E